MSSTVNFNYATQMQDEDTLKASLDRLNFEFEVKGNELSLMDKGMWSTRISLKRGGDNNFVLDVNLEQGESFPSDNFGCENGEELSNQITGVYNLIEMEENLKSRGYTLQSTNIQDNIAHAVLVIGSRA